jgi:predicted  nucleic acid-binding Zn-ribbon protein
MPSPTSNQVVSEAETSGCVVPNALESDQGAGQLEHNLAADQAAPNQAPNSTARRIQQLEQALDQALSYIEELRQQVQNQHLLETQLADTEDYASVQQQAILQLKSQLAEQQQELEAQILETQQRDQAIQELLATIEAMTQAQQREVERLRSRLAQDQRQVQSHRSLLGKHLQDLQAGLESRQQRIAELEAETVTARLASTRLQSQLEKAQQQIRELSARLSHQHSHLAQIETQLEQAQSESSQTLTGQNLAGQNLAGQSQSARGDLLHSRSAAPIPAFAPLANAQRWQQQEVGAERDWLQARVSGLEQQIAELQEQVLRQAQQKTEDETAVQYWKDRYRVGQAQLGHLKDLVQFVQSADLAPALQELLLAIQLLPGEELFEQTERPAGAVGDPDQERSDLPVAPLAPLPSRLATVELPEFLVRRRPGSESCAAKTS